MDYGFAPGVDERGENYYYSLRRAFDRRMPDTRLIHGRPVTSVQQLIAHLGTVGARDTAGGNIVLPIGNLLIGTHAGAGAIEIPMYPGQQGYTEFETLVNTLTTPAHSIAIPDALIGFNAGDWITHSVHIRGCSIGNAKPFLKKFRQALGDHVSVDAPKHLHVPTPEPNYGVFESMAYEFVIRRKDAFPDRATAVVEFQAAGFQLIDGTAVPNNAWADRGSAGRAPWIPHRIDRTRKVVVRAPLGVNLGRRNTIHIRQQFIVDRLSFDWNILYANAGAVPATNDDRLQALRNSLLQNNRFNPAHEFPYYKRLGYSTFEDFFAGHTWCRRIRGRDVCCQRDGSVLLCRGERVEYTVVIPITDPSTGNLFFNFYPDPGSPYAAITTGLLEYDTDFFGTG